MSKLLPLALPCALFAAACQSQYHAIPMASDPAAPDLNTSAALRKESLDLQPQGNGNYATPQTGATADSESIGVRATSRLFTQASLVSTEAERIPASANTTTADAPMLPERKPLRMTPASKKTEKAHAGMKNTGTTTEAGTAGSVGVTTNPSTATGAGTASVTVPDAAPVKAETRTEAKKTSNRRQHDAHVHGHAGLDLVVSGDVLEAEFHAPAEAVYGFEHEAKSDADKAKAEAAVNAFKANIANMISTAPALACKWNDGQIDSRVEGKGGEKHADFRARYEAKCGAPLGGTQIGFGFSKVFKGIRELKVQVVNGDKQSGTEIKADKGTVAL